MKRALKSNDAKCAAMLAQAPRHIRRDYQKHLAAVAALDAAPLGEKRHVARVWAKRLGILPTTLWTKRSEYRRHGKIALLDKRFCSRPWKNRPDVLPPLAIRHLKRLAQDDGLTMAGVISAFESQLARWRAGGKSAKIPGYAKPPSGNPPPGWSRRNLARQLSPRPRKRSERVLFGVVIEFRANGTATWFKRKGRP